MMLRRLAFMVILVGVTTGIFAAPETTTVNGTVYVGGVPATAGSVTATLSQAGVTPDGASEVAVVGTTATSIGGGGAFTIAITPNDAIRPSGTYYNVRITTTAPSSSSWWERWVVSTTPDPVDYAAVTKVDSVPGRIILADFVRYVPTEPTGTCTGADTPRISEDTNKWCECLSGAWSCASMSGGTGHEVQDEGSPLPARAALNFTGAGVTCSDNPAVSTICDIPGGGGGGTPGGTDTQVQFNDATAFGGDAGLTYNKATDYLKVAGSLGVAVDPSTLGSEKVVVLGTGDNIGLARDTAGAGNSVGTAYWLKDAGGTWTKYASVSGGIQDPTDGAEDGSIKFFVQRNGSLFEQARINEEGLNVGAGSGTTSSRKLAVTQNTNGTTEAIVSNETEGTASQALVSVKSVTGGMSLGMRANTWSGAAYQNRGILRADSNADGIVFATGKAGAPLIFHVQDSEKMRLDATGLGVGKTATTAVDVNGTVTATAFSGPLTGNVTGNADTATTATGLACSGCVDSTDYNYTNTLTAESIGAKECVFTTTGTNGGILCEGAVNNAQQTLIEIPAPSVVADLTITLPTIANGGTLTIPSLENAETFTGAKTFKVVNGERLSTTYTDIATALAALPSCAAGVPCVLRIDASEAETMATTKTYDTNPATQSAGKRSAVVIDERNGGLRFLSSKDEFPATDDYGQDERMVPFVFQTRYEDTSSSHKDTSTNEWTAVLDEGNCSVTTSTHCHDDGDCPGETCTNYTGVTDEWHNTPKGNLTSSWGVTANTAARRQYYQSGQCNTGTAANGGTALICGGPHIFEVRGPETNRDNLVGTDKPVFAVGTGGVSIYTPEKYNSYYQGMLTVFRNDDGNGDTSKRNTPMYVLGKQGLFADGGLFVGNVLEWPTFNNQGILYNNLPNNTESWNAYIAHDIDPRHPALIVQGTADATADGEQGPIVTFYGASGASGTSRPLGDFAFQFLNNSILYMGAKCPSDSDGCVGSVDDSQIIRFEGMTADANETELRIEEPTSDVYSRLPNRSGIVQLDDVDAASAYNYVGSFMLHGLSPNDPNTLGFADAVHLQEFYLPVRTKFDRIRIYQHANVTSGLCSVSIYGPMKGDKSVAKKVSSESLDWTAGSPAMRTLSVTTTTLNPGVYYFGIGCADNTGGQFGTYENGPDYFYGRVHRYAATAAETPPASIDFTSASFQQEGLFWFQLWNQATEVK